MARALRIAQVRLDGADTPHSWDFPQGVTVIVGAVGGGKTSLLNLVKFGLGGDAPITAEVAAAARGVVLDVRAGERRLEITRPFKGAIATVVEGERSLGEFALKSGTRRRALSDLLLEAVGIPAVRVPKGRRSRTHELVPISFQDVLSFCYLDQEQVDRSTMYDSDPFRGPKRLWTFELLHGIIDEKFAALTEQREELEAQSDRRSRRLVAVEEFVHERKLLSARAVEARLSKIEIETVRLERELHNTRRAAEAAAGAADVTRGEAAEAESALLIARAEHRTTTLELTGVRRAANQLARDLAAAHDGAEAGRVIDALPYVVCPRCEQALDGRESESGRCVVCLQPDPERWDSAETTSELRRLSEQLEETKSLEQRLQADVVDVASIVRAQVSQLADRQREVRRLVAQATAPHLERANELQERLGALRGERLALQESRRVEAAITGEREELAKLGPRVAELAVDATRHSEELAPARERVEALSEAFDEILRRFTLPWLETAAVDPATYLPRVNSRSLRDLSSGGMKATTNVAYYLAMLVTALRDREILTPSLLMLDSIRKDYGSGEKDLARAEQIYAFLRTLQTMRKRPDALGAEFQLIVVNNDLPEDFTHAFNTILIDPDSPLIHTH